MKRFVIILIKDYLSKQIATIIKDVPMELDLDDFYYQGFDYNELAEFYRRYNMNSLLKRMSLANEENKEETVSRC